MKIIKSIDVGKDHWSLLAYIETRCVDYQGVLNKDHLRIKNPMVANSTGYPHIRQWKSEYGTRLAGYFKDDDTQDKKRQIKAHDDLDCFNDLENAGYIKNTGTGLNPACKMTKLGNQVASLLRQHKADGNHFATFEVN